MGETDGKEFHHIIWAHFRFYQVRNSPSNVNKREQYSNVHYVPLISRQLSNKNHKTELFHRFGHVNYRLGQLECVEAALQGRDVFCLMPTGGGKSVVYQLPAWCCPGIAVVFSPLISLIQDQVEAMNAIKIRAVMSSSGSHDDFMEVIRELSGYISDNRTILDAGN